MLDSLKFYHKRIKEGVLKDMWRETVWIYEYARKYWKQMIFYTLLGLSGTVVSLITSENEVSIRLHERFGFSYCAQIRQAGVKFGRKLGLNAYQIIYDREIE